MTGASTALSDTYTTTLNGIAVSVVPATATMPASSATSFYVSPFTGSTEPMYLLNNNLLDLSFRSSATSADLIAFYDKAFFSQGFVKDSASTMAMQSPTKTVLIYTRGGSQVTLTITGDAVNGYHVMADLTNLKTAS